MSDVEREPIPGLPENLPPGEHIILQTSPGWRSFAIHVFHARKIAIYCAAILVWRMVGEYAVSKSVVAALVSGAWALPIAITGVLLPVGLAYLYARTTIYTLTNRRLVMRFGAALPMTFNLPLRQIAAADLRLYKDGTGDIPVTLTGNDRLAYAHLWPHARPWRFNHPQPMLRAVPDAEKLATLLAAELRTEAVANPKPVAVDAAAGHAGCAAATAAA
jgi:hypothetical protein